MISHRRVLPFISAAVAVLLAARAEGELAVRSPFLPPTANSNDHPETRPELELRGITMMGGVAMFSIFDPERKTGVWVKLDEEGHRFVVKQHDPARDTVTVEQGGRVFSLALRTTKIASANYGVAPLTRVAQGVLSGSSVSDEGRWRDAVTNEINRRVAVRAQANSQAGRL